MKLFSRLVSALKFRRMHPLSNFGQIHAAPRSFQVHGSHAYVNLKVVRTAPGFLYDGSEFVKLTCFTSGDMR